jgi:hypothetical protein
MTFSLPRSGTSRIVALDYEIAQEQASALGRLGRALAAALAALSDHDRSERKAGEARDKLVQNAGHALWCFMVQRECCGLRDPRPVMRDYGVRQEVQSRMGIFNGTSRLSPKEDATSASTDGPAISGSLTFLVHERVRPARFCSPFPMHCY